MYKVYLSDLRFYSIRDSGIDHHFLESGKEETVVAMYVARGEREGINVRYMFIVGFAVDSMYIYGMSVRMDYLLGQEEGRVRSGDVYTVPIKKVCFCQLMERQM